MYCLKCLHPLDTVFKCWSCGIQYELSEKTETANTVINLGSNPLPENADYYYPKNGYIEWEY